MDQDRQVSQPCDNIASLAVVVIIVAGLTSSRIQYKDPTGKTRDWESAERSTRPKGSDIDGVGIVAILEKSTGKREIRNNDCFFSSPLGGKKKGIENPPQLPCTNTALR